MRFGCPCGTRVRSWARGPRRPTRYAPPTLGVPFALRLGGHDERNFGTGEMVLSTRHSPDDRSYYHCGRSFIATGKCGLALTAGGCELPN